MKKSEELEKLCPPPKPSEIAGLSLTATTAMVSGRYINGQVMTVAMWDGKKNPLIVWRFFGDYWTGVRRNKEFEELTVNGNIIHTGRYAGKLLVDELMKDLMEAAATA